MNIVTVLEEQAQRWPDRPAIIDEQSGCSPTTSFAELHRISATRATLLARHGLRPGDPVILLCPLSRDFYVNLLAIFRLGAVGVVFDPSAGLRHIERCCDLAKPKALIGSWKAHLLRLVSPSIRRVPLRLPAHSDVSEQVEPSPVAGTNPDTAALLTFTSGSTGIPKAAIRTHGFLLDQHKVLESALALVPGTCDLTTLPIFVLANLGSGVTSVLPNADLRRPGSIKPEPVIRQIREWEIQSTVASPAFLSRLAETKCTLPSLQRIFVGGGPVFPSLLARLHIVAPEADLVVVYGSTECEPISMISSQQIGTEDLAATARGGGLVVGQPIPEITLRILPDRWGQQLPKMSRTVLESQCVPLGQTGEIVVSGPHVLHEYLYGEGDASTKFQVDGTIWHRTGDCGYLDNHGRLWLAGSASAKIRDAHGTLYPLTVEAAASGFPNVRRAALVSLNSTRVLAVEWTGEPSVSDGPLLRQWLAWAAVDEVRSLPHLPTDRRHNAKIDYGRLAQELATRHRGTTRDKNRAPSTARRLTKQSPH